jgi:hypothetical protein
LAHDGGAPVSSWRPIAAIAAYATSNRTARFQRARFGRASPISPTAPASRSFDEALKEGARSSAAAVAVPERPARTAAAGMLRLMGRRADEKSRRPIAREVCERTASKAMIAGAISQLGQSYIISLDASNCRTGDTIEKQQVQASGKDEVLKALGTAAGQLRSRTWRIACLHREIRRADSGSDHRVARRPQGLWPRDVDAAPPGRYGVVTVLPQGDRAGSRLCARSRALSTVYGNMGEPRGRASTSPRRTR